MNSIRAFLPVHLNEPQSMFNVALMNEYNKNYHDLLGNKHNE